MLRGFISLLFASASIRDCSVNQNVAQITNMEIEPVTPISGDNVTVHIDYNLFKDITGGTVEYWPTLNGIPFSSFKENLCDVDKYLTCPQVPGSYTEIGSNILPEMTGKFVLKTIWTNQDNEQIWCIESTFRLTPDDL